MHIIYRVPVRRFLLYILLMTCIPAMIILVGCTGKKDTAAETKAISAVLDSLNATAARADYDSYFKLYADSSVFTGTDATERWDKPAFMAWASPIFKRGRAWNFTSIERHIYLNKTADLAWFDELLQTQMKICRGSGVLSKQGDDWKIEQYILSATIPNDLIDTVTVMKAPQEDSIIQKLISH